jgi:hypothetical protein
MDELLYQGRNFVNDLTQSTSDESAEENQSLKIDFNKTNKESKSNKDNFDEEIRNIVLDTKDPKFDQYYKIGDNKIECMEVAKVSYGNNNYKVLYDLKGNVVITEDGIPNSTDIIPKSLRLLEEKEGDLEKEGGLSLSAFLRLASKNAEANRIDKEKSSSITLRDFNEEFNGKNKGEALKEYLKKPYIDGKMKEIAGYSFNIDKDNNISIGKIGYKLKPIKNDDSSINLALFKVVSELSKGKSKEGLPSKPISQPSNSPSPTGCKNLSTNEMGGYGRY